jgi:hypothetical protein
MVISGSTLAFRRLRITFESMLVHGVPSSDSCKASVAVPTVPNSRNNKYGTVYEQGFCKHLADVVVREASRMPTVCDMCTRCGSAHGTPNSRYGTSVGFFSGSSLCFVFSGYGTSDSRTKGRCAGTLNAASSSGRIFLHTVPYSGDTVLSTFLNCFSLLQFARLLYVAQGTVPYVGSVLRCSVACFQDGSFLVSDWLDRRLDNDTYNRARPVTKLADRCCLHRTRRYRSCHGHCSFPIYLR